MGYALGEHARREAVKVEMVVYGSGSGGAHGDGGGCEEEKTEGKKVWENLGTHQGYFCRCRERGSGI